MNNVTITETIPDDLPDWAIKAMAGGQLFSVICAKAKEMDSLLSDARIEAVGWAYADCCVTLDNGCDPRKTEMSGVIERVKADLDRPTKGD